MPRAPTESHPRPKPALDLPATSPLLLPPLPAPIPPPPPLPPLLRYVCYAEDPTPLSAIAPSLYSTFIAQPHVPTATGAGRSADGRSAFGAFIDRVSAAAAPPDETVYWQADGGGGHWAAAGKRGGGGAAGQAGSSTAEERLAPATQDL